ncbi:MAG: mandelate racemase/muconate lactonizing enzyme family protein [Armatimonadetes bacterium]|nr:mandelate racemase/muconate lactonizing enzyme family protein [Armatimonadota bacterium]
MRIAALELTTVSVPYTHRENSSQVNRDGVTDVVVRIVTDDGSVGWGESCSGANVESVYEALRAFEPLLLGRNPWNREALWHDCYRRGIWNFREPTFNFAWAGVDMALWDLCGKAAGQPIYNLLGGLRRTRVSYFWYLPTGDLSVLEEECRRGVAAGFEIFYIKTGIDIEREVEALRIIRQAIGPDRKIRIDANEAWSVAEAARNLRRLDQYGVDFAEQPVPADPVENMIELKQKTDVLLAANEGLWRVADAWEVITRRACDVLCFSPYWVGSIGHFHRLSCVAALQGMRVCKHTHGELGIAAAAGQQVLLTLPRIVEGHQQTATMMADDILTEPIPIARQPHWGVPSPPGLGIEVDPDKLARYHENYRRIGQYRPYRIENLASEDPAWRSARPPS